MSTKSTTPAAPAKPSRSRTGAPAAAGGANKTRRAKPAGAARPVEKKRQDHPPHVKAEINDRYWLHRMDDEKDWLCEDYDIVEDGKPRRTKLYNLISRMGGTRARREVQERNLTPEERNARAQQRMVKLRSRIPFSEDLFADRDDLFLARHFGEFTPDELSIARRLPESAILYRARQLGLRRTPVLWEVESVKAWLGIDEPQLEQLLTVLEVHAFKPARDGALRRRVTTKSLVALLTMEGPEGVVERWVARGADEFFVREIVEHAVGAEIGDGSGHEACLWLDAGHACGNPAAGAACDTFCSRNRLHEAGEDPTCEENEIRNKPIAEVSLGRQVARRS